MEFLYETHVHTSEVSACAISTAAEQVLAYRENCYTGVIITDHFVNGNSTCNVGGLSWDEKMKKSASGYLNALAAGERYGVDVFFGWEYTIRGLDFLTYGLDVDFLIEHPGMDRLCISDYSELVRENGGYIAQAHPYRSAWYIENGGPVDPQLLDGIEAYNASDSKAANEKALKFAKRHKLPMQGGSDSHSAAHRLHGHYSGIILDFRAEDIFEIIEAIKDGRAQVI